MLGLVVDKRLIFFITAHETPFHEILNSLFHETRVRFKEFDELFGGLCNQLLLLQCTTGFHYSHKCQLNLYDTFLKIFLTIPSRSLASMPAWPGGYVIFSLPPVRSGVN